MCFFINSHSSDQKIDWDCKQGTPPFMAIEALTTGKNDEFAHLLRHDLESILYVILVICTFTKGPNLPRLESETPDTVSMNAWFKTDTIKVIGFHKLGDMALPECTIIPEFTDYWRDFAPFGLAVIQLCFPYQYNPGCPNQLTYDRMAAILDKAYHAVQEPSTGLPVSAKKPLKRVHPSKMVLPKKKRKLGRAK